MQENEYREKLYSCKNFGDIFELVKEIVYKKFKKSRGGLSLYLVNAPKYILAYHIMGSNLIAINRTVLEALYQITDDIRKINSYIFVVLLHEYLHSLGIYDERLVTKIEFDICQEFFGEDHITTQMINKGILEIFPDLKYLLIKIKVKEGYELVRDFDRSSTSKYIF
jgi:hypothetical protein